MTGPLVNWIWGDCEECLHYKHSEEKCYEKVCHYQSPEMDCRQCIHFIGVGEMCATGEAYAFYLKVGCEDYEDLEVDW